MISRYRKFIVTVMLPVFLTGCWDYNDVNKREITISVGVDYVNDEVEFTGESAKLLPGLQQNKTTVQPSEVYTFDSLGKYFEGARNDLDANIPKPDFFGAIRCIVVSKNFAAKGIESYINRLDTIVGFRDSVLVAISNEPPKDLFRNKVENDISIGYAIDDTVKYLDDNGMALHKSVQEIKSDIDFRNIGYLLPYVTFDKNAIKYLGLAAMKDSKEVGIIPRNESSGFLFVLSKKPVKVSVFSNPSDDKNLLSIKTNLAKRRIKTSYKDKQVNIDIDLKLKSQLQYEYFNEALSKQDIKKLEQMISNQMEESITTAAKLSQEEFKSDVFGFARYFKADNPEAYKSIDWNQEYPNVVFHVNVDTTLLNMNVLDPNAKKPD